MMRDKSRHVSVLIFFDKDGDVDLARSRVYTNLERARQVLGDCFDLPKKPYWSMSMIQVDDSGPLPEVKQLSLLEADEDA